MKPMNSVLDSAGCYNEIEFWSQYSGLGSTKGTWVDHMVAALGKNGYSGTPGDMYRAWVTNMGNMLYAPLSGLTFYKDFTKIPAGTYSTASLLNANLSVGSGAATFTSTDSSFTIDATKGYNATTANDEVLKYLTSGNRTAAQETIVIKFTPTGDFANDGVYRWLLGSDTKDRCIRKSNTSALLASKPNTTDFSGVGTNLTTTLLDGISYVITSVFVKTTPNALIYLNGVFELSSTTNTWDGTIAWGTFFEVGCDNGGANQIEGHIKSVAFFNRVLTTSEASAVTNLM